MDKNRVIALATVVAVTAHGTRSHPVVDQVLKGYIKTKEKGGQLELEKLLEAASLHEALSATKKKPITAKVNVVKANKTNAGNKQENRKQSAAPINNKDQESKPPRAIIKYDSSLTLDMLMCGKCRSAAHKSADCPTKKDGCKYCGKNEKWHKGDCFWKLQDEVRDRVAGKVTAVVEAE